MGESSRIPIRTLIQRILARVQPSATPNLSNLLTNVELFIEFISGSPLTDQEKTFPPHSFFSHLTRIGGPEVVEILMKRLELIDHYEVDNVQDITDIMTWEYPVLPSERLTTRKARLLRELYNDPLLPKYQLAKRLDITPRIVNRELRDLQQRFAFQIYTSLDPHRFKLAQYLIFFRTKSMKDSHRLEQLFQEQQGFLLTFRFDRDLRRGIIGYRIPDQKKGHQKFEQRVQWLEDEFLSNYLVCRVQGHHYYVSFSGYDPARNAFLLEADIVSEAMLRFVKEHHNTIPSPQGFYYSNPVQFDKADYLLALTLFSTGAPASADYKRALLKRFKIEMSKKTIWNRLQRLRQRQVGYPIVDLKIPGFDEQVGLLIQCTPRTKETLQKLPSILPYSFIYTTNSGIFLCFQRPIRCSSIAGQLIRTIHRERGVKKIELLRYGWRVSPPSVINVADRLDSKNQVWTIHERDI